MSGKEILVDTNILIYLLKGNVAIKRFLNEKHIYVSFITELELLSYRNITPEQETIIKELLENCVVIPINEKIRNDCIGIRKAYSLKLADSIIVATSLAFDMPLFTADQQLQQVRELDLLLYQNE